MDKATMRGLDLWYARPAANWFEALPLGNGRVGVMAYGGVMRDSYLLTESTCWSGEAASTNSRAGAPQAVVAGRDALFAGQYARAEALAEDIVGMKLNYGTNLPLGRLTLELPSVVGEEPEESITDYRRSLDLDRALVRTCFRWHGIYYTREAFVSYPHGIVVVRLTTDRPGATTYRVVLDGTDNPSTTVLGSGGDLLLNGHAFEDIHSDGRTGVAFHGRLHVVADGGQVTADSGTLVVSDADAVTLLLALGTTFGGSDPEEVCRAQIVSASSLSYDDLRRAHIADHRRLFDRVRLDLGADAKSEISTDERLDRLRHGHIDPALDALMFQVGRYLLLSSSRGNSPLPAHLQGVWNDGVACRIGWTCDMHLDINTQMNYWPAEVTHLGECTAPLFNWIETCLVPSGRQTAHATYECPGWIAHTVSNAWGFSAPGWSTHWGLHPTAGAWIASHLWEHYRFTGDHDFLVDHAYPVLKEAAEFFLAYLTEDPESGWLVSGPSSSPENAFLYEGQRYVNSMGVTCDSVIIRDLFSACIAASTELDDDPAFRQELVAAVGRLPPFKVGRHGQLQEWLEDYEEALPHHRHTSHLLALFPFNQIDPDVTPRWAAAAQVSIARRTQPASEWEDTGWARSLLMLYMARLHDGEAAYGHIRAMQRQLTRTNLFVVHPPAAGAQTDVWEMDGNTGLCSCIAEMLLQSHGASLHLLPALPRAWPVGQVAGLCGRGGFAVDIAWQGGVLTSARIRATRDGVCRVRYGTQRLEMDVRAGDTLRLDGNLTVSTNP